jgi:hypothetical protein
MAQIRTLALAGLVVAAGLVAAAPARAGLLADLFGCGDCPRPSYSPLNYWAPAAVKASDCIHGPFVPLHAPEIHPDISPGTYMLQYPCPPVLPVDTLIPTPTPPATSKFRY